MEQSIEKHIGETLYKQLFYPCRTLELYSKQGNVRTFVEYATASDYGFQVCPNIEEQEVAAGNAVLRLIAENNDDFFFGKGDTGARPVYTGKGTYWIKYNDISERWENHYWTRLKTPLIGFKAVSSNGEPIFTSYQTEPICYTIGQSYIADETKMIEDCKGGFYFSPFITKALNYKERDGRVLLVVASGLIFIKNSWDDLCSSKLTIVRELSREDIELLTPSIHKPAALWNGFTWELQTEIEQSE